MKIFKSFLGAKGIQVVSSRAEEVKTTTMKKFRYQEFGPDVRVISFISQTGLDIEITIDKSTAADLFNTFKNTGLPESKTKISEHPDEPTSEWTKKFCFRNPNQIINQICFKNCKDEDFEIEIEEAFAKAIAAIF